MSPAGFAVFWLGTATDDGLMLSSVYSDAAEVDLDYADCSRYEAAECPPSISLRNSSTCTSQPLFLAGYQTERVTRVGDALLYTNKLGENFPELYAGATTVSIFTDQRQYEPVVTSLRRANGDSQPGVFPLARLPSRFWRRIERASAARRKYGTAEAARRLGHSPTALKERVAIHRRLRELGRFGRLDCRRSR